MEQDARIRVVIKSDKAVEASPLCIEMEALVARCCYTLLDGTTMLLHPLEESDGTRHLGTTNLR
jgi:hypothetical protein